MTTTLTPPPTPIRKLTRSTDDKKIAGVSGGMGDYFGIDPVIFRLGFVVTTVFPGAGLLAYIIAWVILPKAAPEPVTPAADEPASVATPEPMIDTSTEGTMGS